MSLHRLTRFSTLLGFPLVLLGDSAAKGVRQEIFGVRVKIFDPVLRLSEMAEFLL
jgi:hypothetical protein